MFLKIIIFWVIVPVLSLNKQFIYPKDSFKFEELTSIYEFLQGRSGLYSLFLPKYFFDVYSIKNPWKIFTVYNVTNNDIGIKLVNKRIHDPYVWKN